MKTVLEVKGKHSLCSRPVSKQGLFAFNLIDIKCVYLDLSILLLGEEHQIDALPPPTGVALVLKQATMQNRWTQWKVPDLKVNLCIF